MFRTRSLLLAAALLPALALAQHFDPLRPPDTYRNADNPYYWRNHPPTADYWQQDVHYDMAVRLDEVKDIAEGKVRLVYYNNSPDTLREVFFHLYQEAFNAGSYMDQLLRSQGKPGRNPDRKFGTELHSLEVGGRALEREQDNTIVRARLNEPLPPGAHVTFNYSFTTHWGGMRRMKVVKHWGVKHFDGCHWYPRISVYDRKFGWDTQQHMNHELYGNFGTFDVALDMPNDMVVEATGWLQNPQEVLPPALREALDLKHFVDKPWNSPPSVVTAYQPGVRKVWRYHAENVHDFAFTADPLYRIDEVEWNGIKCIAVVQEPHASKWKNAAEYCKESLRVLSEMIGPYAYPKMVVADAYDGMEYPMLTLDSGNDPNYRGLFVHEIAHNWFYGMVGNNETYRAMLDEGITQYYTAEGVKAIDGDTVVMDPRATAHERRYDLPRSPREHSVYNGYMPDAIRHRAPPINVHSDEFAYYGGTYRHVYYKTGVMLYNLRYVLGDSLFNKAMQGYFARWRMAHPYVEDFRQTVIDITKVDLNWFFDQWIETDKTIDYAVGPVKRRFRDNGQRITFRRKGSMQMPLDFTVIARDGKRYDYHIPNTWFVKPTTATVLPRWIGFDDLKRKYTATVDIPNGIADVMIDTSHTLADVYQLNNSLRLPSNFTLDHGVSNRPDRRYYEGFGRPDLWWNGFDGIKMGVHFNGNWMRYKHHVEASAWLNTGFAQYVPAGISRVDHEAIHFNVLYRNGTERFLKGSTVQLEARYLDGLQRYAGRFLWTPDKGRTNWSTGVRYLIRRGQQSTGYLLYPTLWEREALNATMDLAVDRSERFWGGNTTWQAELRGSTIGAAAGFAQLRGSATSTHHICKLPLRTRLIAQFGSGNTPRESALYLAGASPEEMMENKYVRSVGIVPYPWTTLGGELNHFQHGGGLNLRGYAGYVAPELLADGTLISTYHGNSGAAINAELDLDELIKWHPRTIEKYIGVDLYLFGDIGTMGYRSTTEAGTTRLRLAAPRADAGIGTALTIKRFGPLNNARPLVLRFDMPLFISHLPYGESDHFGFRFVVGVNRSF